MSSGCHPGIHGGASPLTASSSEVPSGITAITGTCPNVRYTGAVETPLEQTHLAEGTAVLEFGPENIASMYVPRPEKKAR